MKKKTNKRCSDFFNVDVYDTIINVGICSDVEDLERWYYELSEDDIQDDGFFPVVALYFNDFNEDHWIIFTKDIFDLNTCAHECFHLTHHFMNDIQHEFRIESHEPHAWLNGFLVENVYNIGNKLLKNFK